MNKNIEYSILPVMKGDFIFYKDITAFPISMWRTLFGKSPKYADCWIAVEDMILIVPKNSDAYRIFRAKDHKTKDEILKVANPKLVQCKYTLKQVMDNPGYEELYNDEK